LKNSEHCTENTDPRGKKPQTSLLRISTHILDTSRGCPADNVPVQIYKFIDENSWKLITGG